MLTTQYHPEITFEFMTALLEEYGPALGNEIHARAERSLGDRPDIDAWAQRIATFLSDARSTESV